MSENMKGSTKHDHTIPEPVIPENAFQPISSLLAGKLSTVPEPEISLPTLDQTEGRASAPVRMETKASTSASSSKFESSRKTSKSVKIDDQRGITKSAATKKNVILENQYTEKEAGKKATQKRTKRKHSKTDSEDESEDDCKRKRMEKMEKKIDSLTSTVSMLAQMMKEKFATPDDSSYKEKESFTVPQTSTTSVNSSLYAQESPNFSLPADAGLQTLRTDMSADVTIPSAHVSSEPLASTSSQQSSVPLHVQAPHCSANLYATPGATFPLTSQVNTVVSDPIRAYDEIPTDPASLLFDTPPQPPLNRVDFCSGLKAGENLPEKIKTKIWEDKYVDFYCILHPDNDPMYSLNISVSSTQNPALSLLPRKHKVLNEREWNSAFDDYIAVYCRRFPERLYDLLTYGKFIKNLMAKGHNWAYYDVNYRRDREHSKCPWTVIRIDLQIEAAQFSESKKLPFRSKEYPKRKQIDDIPVGYCFLYHTRSRRCEQVYCKYKHECTVCSKRHPIYLCTEGSSANTTINNRPHTANKIQNQNTFANPSAGGRLVIPTKRVP